METTCDKAGCGEQLEGSIKLYLDNVALDAEGMICQYRVLTPDLKPADSDADIANAVHRMINEAEGDELAIYCRDDHEVTSYGSVRNTHHNRATRKAKAIKGERPSNNHLGRLLHSAASALDHGRVNTARKKFAEAAPWLLD